MVNNTNPNQTLAKVERFVVKGEVYEFDLTGLDQEKEFNTHIFHKERAPNVKQIGGSAWIYSKKDKQDYCFPGQTWNGLNDTPIKRVQESLIIETPEGTAEIPKSDFEEKEPMGEMRVFEHNPKAPPKVGDIFKTAWGYDQTNYDFVVVTEVSKTGKTVKCRMSKAETLPSEEKCYDHLKPTGEPYGDEFRLHVRVWQDEYHLTGSYPFVQGDLSKGKRKGWFSKHDGRKGYWQTAWGYGH